MKRIAIAYLYVMAFVVSVSCSKRKYSVTTNCNGASSDRLIRIDSAFASWYTQQLGAASQIDYILDIKFGPINIGRDPEEILQEQRKDIAEVEMRMFPEKGELGAAIKRWHDYQLNAANCLRQALSKSPIIDDGKQNYELILDLQQRDVATLKRETATLGSEHWNQTK